MGDVSIKLYDDVSRVLKAGKEIRIHIAFLSYACSLLQKKAIGENAMIKLKKKAFTIMSCLPVFAAEPGISLTLKPKNVPNMTQGVFIHTGRKN